MRYSTCVLWSCILTLTWCISWFIKCKGQVCPEVTTIPDLICQGKALHVCERWVIYTVFPGWFLPWNYTSPTQPARTSLPLLQKWKMLVSESDTFTYTMRWIPWDVTCGIADVGEVYSVFNIVNCAFFFYLELDFWGGFFWFFQLQLTYSVKKTKNEN